LNATSCHAIPSQSSNTFGGWRFRCGRPPLSESCEGIELTPWGRYLDLLLMPSSIKERFEIFILRILAALDIGFPSLPCFSEEGHPSGIFFLDYFDLFKSCPYGLQRLCAILEAGQDGKARSVLSDLVMSRPSGSAKRSLRQTSVAKPGSEEVSGTAAACFLLLIVWSLVFLRDTRCM
jgi:hypothetical protein